LAVGLDTPTTPSFGFTTLLLMENNLRIKFDDTSSSASFPNNDWSLEANESSNGGRNAFFLRDCGVSSQGNCSGNAVFTVEAGARNNALYVEDDGDIGIGTSTPAVDVHIQTGNTPTLRLAQDGTSGFTPQTWDMAGNETNFFIRDATNGSTLPFRIRPGAPTSAIDVAASGNVGFNTSSPDQKLHVRDTASGGGFVHIEDTTGAAGFLFSADSSGADHQWTIISSTQNRLGIREDGSSASEHFTINGGSGNGNIGFGVTNPTNPIDSSTGAFLDSLGVWQDASSRELKTEIRDLPLADAVGALAQLNPVSFKYKRDTSEDRLGFIAEDVPELVATAGRKGLSSMQIVAVVTKVVQEQQQLISELAQRVEQLEAEKRAAE
jgi:hypothetical protein